MKPIFFIFPFLLSIYSCDNSISTGFDNPIDPIIPENNCISMFYNSEIPISGFQFDHSSCVGSIDGGLADEYGFTLTNSESTVVGFSLLGEPIPAGEGVLLNLIVEDDSFNSDCLSDFIFSDEDANNITNHVILEYDSCADLSVLSWNIPNFPTSGHTTVEYVSSLINELDPDIIGLQEMPDISKEGLSVFLDSMHNYTYIYGTKTNNSSNTVSGISFLYKSSNTMDFVNYEEILVNHLGTVATQPFPRAPLLLAVRWNGEKIYIINNHLKAYGDDESVERRQKSSELLYDYIADNLSSEKVIMMGDLNDSLTDLEYDNVFNIFLQDETNYIIADIDIANGHSDFWSYPSYPSHIDHIILSTELSSSFNKSGSTIETILFDLTFNSWDEYEAMVSDHRPMYLKLSY